MDWFKHSTASHDDPDIMDAWDEFGDAGYAVFFITLEIFGDEFNHRNSENELSISRSFLKRKLRKSWTKVQQILNFYQKRKRIFYRPDTTDDAKILLSIPKYIEMASNWTKRTSGVTSVGSSVVPTAKVVEVEEGEEDKEKDIEKDTFLDSISAYKSEWKIDLQVDGKWFVQKVKNNFTFKDINLNEEIEKWANWIETQYRLKQSQKSNLFPKTFKNSLTNWLKRVAEKTQPSKPQFVICPTCQRDYDKSKGACPRCK